MKLAVWASFLASLISVVVTLFTQQKIISDKYLELSICEARTERYESRLREVDCDAPLTPGAPFHGLGLYRAVNCQHKPVSAVNSAINCRHTDQHTCECEWTER